MTSCVVIGAGITGLSASIILAQNGIPVTLVEKSQRIAPLLRGFSRAGVHFDTGFHHAKGLRAGGPLRCWLESLGLNLNFNACQVVTEVACTNHGSYLVPFKEGFIENIFPNLAGAYRNFCETGARMQERSPYMTGDSSAQFSILPTATTPLAEYISGLGFDSDLEKVLLARCMLFGVSPQDASVEDFFLVAGDPQEESMTIPGGGLTLVEAFEQRIAELDIHLICGQAVTAINADGRFLKSITLENGKTVNATHVIYTGHPRQLKNMIPKSALRPAWFTHIETMPETAEPLALYGTCGEILPALHTWYSIPNNGKLNYIEDDDPAMCVMTGSVGNHGRKSCMVLVPSSGNAPVERLLTILEEKFPILNGDEGFHCLGSFSGETMRRYIYGSTGSIYGNAHRNDTLPLVPVTRLNGFFLAGQSILLPGILGCIISAAVATSMIIGVQNTLKKFGQCVNVS